MKKELMNLEYILVYIVKHIMKKIKRKFHYTKIIGTK